MSADVRRGGPGQETASGTLASTSVPSPDFDALDELAQVVGGTFVLVVETTGGRYRRRCYLSAAAAERSAYRALTVGHNAKVYLAELKPLWLLKGSEVSAGADQAGVAEDAPRSR